MELLQARQVKLSAGWGQIAVELSGYLYITELTVPILFFKKPLLVMPKSKHRITSRNF